MSHQWYLIKTQANREKFVYKQLVQRNFEAYLPLEAKSRQWSDRVKIIEFPKYKQYLFVKTSIDRKLELYEIKYLLEIVSKVPEIDGKPDISF